MTTVPGQGAAIIRLQKQVNKAENRVEELKGKNIRQAARNADMETEIGVLKKQVKNLTRDEETQKILEAVMNRVVEENKDLKLKLQAAEQQYYEKADPAEELLQSKHDLEAAHEGIKTEGREQNERIKETIDTLESTSIVLGEWIGYMLGRRKVIEAVIAGKEEEPAQQEASEVDKS